MLKKVFLCAGLVWGVIFHQQAQSVRQHWVDSVFQTLTEEEKIGQLFMIPVSARTDPDYLDKISAALESHHVGGLVYQNGGPLQIARLNDRLQAQVKVPLLMGVDAGRGLGQAIDSTQLFPSPMVMGTIQDGALIYQAGFEIARQMKHLGLHINFAPTANAVPGYDSLQRFFGENGARVAEAAVAFMKGLQDNGVIACAKHFSVRGITVTQVGREGLPSVNTYVDSLEAYPFNRLLDEKLKAVLSASTDFPLLYERKTDLQKNKLSAGLLSSVYAGKWLREVRQYDGLVMVNIPDIDAEDGDRGDAELYAFEAGNDVIISPSDIAPAVRKIKRLIRREPAYAQLLDDKVKKILSTKFDVGLHTHAPLATTGLHGRLHTSAAKSLYRRLLEHSVVRLRDEHAVLPFLHLEDKTFATVSLGKVVDNDFARFTERYIPARHFSSLQHGNEETIEQLENVDVIIVALFEDPARHPEMLERLRSMQAGHRVVVIAFGSPQWLSQLDVFGTLVYAPLPSEDMLALVPQALFGANAITGKLPVSLAPGVGEGQGMETPTLGRMGYSFPEDAGISSSALQKIERIAKEAMDLEATPGGQVLVAREGKVVYEHAFGHLAYDGKIPVTDDVLYDLASVTKVAATLQAIMFLYDHGQIDVYKKASHYLPELRATNKRDYTLKDILTHQAGLWPFLPFWSQTVKDTVHLPEFYQRTYSAEYPFQVSENLYARATMRDSLWTWIQRAKVRDKPARTPYDYRYSDMGFYILQHLAEKLLNQPMEDFLRQNLYDPLGAHSTGYLPLKRFPRDRIAPTEEDKLFRRNLLVGTVHDQGAAMHGGVAGHAGLFSNANDLAKLGQMLLQGGYYGGIQYYKPSTVQTFTRQQYGNSRRGLGWDKPVVGDWNSPTSAYASAQTFGHTGFTGTCIWVDPEFDLVFIFLSNRVHPDMNNTKLLAANIRSRIQDVIYEAIFQYCQKNSGELNVPDAYVQKNP